MDNSGSLLSSSEAEEEYDSRGAVDSVSAFISGRPMSNSPQPPQQFFDPIPSYLHLHQSPAINWAGSSEPAARSDPIPDEVVANHPPTQLQPPARNPRKRSRASRRAPTTVLTTDTANFRAMVQEFTGIPSPPFGGSSRFDLLGPRFASAQPPPYLRRPFAQKIQSRLPFPAAAPSSLFTTAAAATTIDAAAAARSVTGIGAVPNSSADLIQVPQINYQLQPISKFPNQFTVNPNPNPIFTSILQGNPKFSIPSPPLIPPRSQANNSFNLIPSNDDHFNTLGHGNPDSPTLPSLPNATRWGNNPEIPNAEKLNPSSINGGFSFRSSELNFEGDKLPGSDVTAASREGIVGSSSSSPWISSD